METLSISEVARRFDLAPHTLRFYEKEGVLRPGRTAGGIRFYTEEDISRLEMAMCLKNTGMSLKDIRRYFELVGEGDEALTERLKIFEEHRTHVLGEIEELKRHLKKIDEKIRYTREAIAAREEGGQ